MSLATRATTASLFVLFVLLSFLGGFYTFAAMFALITLLALWEFLNMALRSTGIYRNFHVLIGIVLGIHPFLLTLLFKLELINVSLSFQALTIIGLSILFLLMIVELLVQSKASFHNIAYILLGVAYIGLPFALYLSIAYEDGQYTWRTPLGILLLMWIYDSAAYVFGSNFGKHKLLPRVSPKKTWEGVLGALPVTLFVAFLIYIVFGDNLALWEWLGLALIVVIFGTLGDLVESMFKRNVDTKDSGRLLPGHGGILDRFDGFLFLMPFAVAYLWLLSN